MTDLLTIFFVLAATGLMSFIIFALTVQQTAPPGNIQLMEIFNEVNVVARKLRRLWAQSRLFAIFVGLGTFWIAYMRLKNRNFFGRIDSILINVLGVGFVAVASIGGWDVVMELIKAGLDWLERHNNKIS
jgi:hypothetical protein